MMRGGRCVSAQPIEGNEMRILHLSDFHLRGDGGLSFRVVDTLECLRVVADHLKTLVQKPDALVIPYIAADRSS